MSDPDDLDLTPAELANDIYDYLKEAKEAHLWMAEHLDHSLSVARVTKEYWNKVDATSFENTPTGGTAIAGLQAFHDQVSEYRQNLYGVRLSAEAVNSTASSYGTLTATAFQYVRPVEDFDPVRIYEAIDRPGRNEQYAGKFERFDPELGRLYRQILQVQSLTTSYPEKSALPDVRQTFDCMLNRLVPDRKVVRNQSWWPEWSPNPEDNSKITTPQCLRYAAETHVQNHTLQGTLVADSIHVLTVYKQLNVLFHTTSPIDTDKALAASHSMVEVLNMWADALEL